MKRKRKGISLIEFVEDLFPDEESAYQWFYEKRWPNGPCCPHCGSLNIQEGSPHKTMTHRCWDCPGKREFSLRVGTVMESSKLSYRTWGDGDLLHHHQPERRLLLETSPGPENYPKNCLASGAPYPKGVRCKKEETCFPAPSRSMKPTSVARERNKHESKKLHAGRGAVGKTAVVGMKDRNTNQVKAAVVPHTDQRSLEGFIKERVEPGSKVYTDDHGGY